MTDFPSCLSVGKARRMVGDHLRLGELRFKSDVATMTVSPIGRVLRSEDPSKKIRGSQF